MSNLGLERFLQGQGLDMVRTPVGDRYVLEQMLKGGYNLAASRRAYITSRLRHDRRRLCRRTAGCSRWCRSCAGRYRKSATASIRYRRSSRTCATRAAKPLDDADVKSAIDAGEKRLNGHGRLLIRPSGTEPVIRVMAEGDDRIMVEKLSTRSCTRSARPPPPETG